MYNDYGKEILNLLSQLTSTPTISYQNFLTFLHNIPNNQHIFVIEENNKIIAYGSIIIEYKIIHNLGKVAHMEDIVVHNDYRKKGVGKIMVEHLVDFSRKNGCYKIIASCNDKNISFYNKLGFNKHHNHIRYNL